MGLLDVFKKKHNVENIGENIERPQEQIQHQAEYGRTQDGRLSVDFYDETAKFGQLYDTTRLIVNERPLSLGERAVYNCMVSWYGHDDCSYLDNSGREMGRKANYRGVLAEIDLNLIKRDPTYCEWVMKGLLDKKRVEKYLDTGLIENPETPCGKYIGGVRPTEQGYEKFFSGSAGKASHNSELMVNRRLEHRQKQETKRQQAILDKQAQIVKLQNEVDDLSK